MTPVSTNKNIVITGFMGTGKTTVGLLVAERLGRPFVDMDARLEAHFGKPISAVFAEDGETAFRTAESQLCQQLSQESGLVIATGGGALVYAENRQNLGRNGVLVCLMATPDEILTRLESFNDRPLLAGSREERRQRVAELLARRQPAYATIPYQVETNGCTLEQVAQRVLEAVEADAEAPGMTRISLATPQECYQICVGEGLLSRIGLLLANRKLSLGPAAIVTNPDIAGLYGERAVAGLREAGFQPAVCTVPEGEQHKTLANIAALYDQFLTAGLDRRSPVIALGGGVIGDMAGFAAATYLRGVPFVQVPTTLLAMVDASVGGKTGVDLPQGKNLVGAFKQPQVVVIDPAVLETLPAPEFRSGLAEVVKHGIIGAPALFHQLETTGPSNLTQLVVDAVRVKVDIVLEDPFEHGRRAVLNLGHTFGHALELVSDFQLRHGEAVAVGMVAATRLASSLGFCDETLLGRVVGMLERLGLPVRAPGYSVDAVHAAMSHDKKRQGRTLRFVIPRAIGDVILIDDPGPAPVRAALAHVLASK